MSQSGGADQEPPGLHRSSAPSIDAKLVDNPDALVGIFASEEVPPDAKGLVYGRDTLISPRERTELTRALQRPSDQRQPANLALIVELMTRCSPGALLQLGQLHSALAPPGDHLHPQHTLFEQSPCHCSHAAPRDCASLAMRSHGGKLCAHASRTKIAESFRTGILQALAKTMQFVACGKGDPVVAEGEEGNHMYILVSGCCVVEKADRTRRPARPCRHFGRVLQAGQRLVAAFL
jgi:hypothetical protein